MSIVASHAVDRRISTRFKTNLAGEFVAGSALVPVTIHDLSATGCGIEVLAQDPYLSDHIKAVGLLNVLATDRTMPATILPVIVRNMRYEGYVLRYGLEFQRLMPHQMRKLIGIMEDVIPEETAKAPSLTSERRFLVEVPNGT